MKSLLNSSKIIISLSQILAFPDQINFAHVNFHKLRTQSFDLNHTKFIFYSVSETEMEQRHINTINKNAKQLTRDLQITQEFMAILREKGKLSDEEIEWYNLPTNTSQRKSTEFQMKIKKKGPEAFRYFIDALVQTKQLHLARALNPTLAKHYENLHFPANTPEQEIGQPKLSEIAVPNKSHDQPTSIALPPIDTTCENTNKVAETPSTAGHSSGSHVPAEKEAVDPQLSVPVQNETASLQVYIGFH